MLYKEMGSWIAAAVSLMSSRIPFQWAVATGCAAQTLRATQAPLSSFAWITAGLGGGGREARDWHADECGYHSPSPDTPADRRDAVHLAVADANLVGAFVKHLLDFGDRHGPLHVLLVGYNKQRQALELFAIDYPVFRVGEGEGEVRWVLMLLGGRRRNGAREKREEQRLWRTKDGLALAQSVAGGRVNHVNDSVGLGIVLPRGEGVKGGGW